MTHLRFAILPILVALSASASRAQEASTDAASCARGRVEADLGIDGFECTGCYLRSRSSELGPWRRFTSPPTIRLVRAGGPAYMKLMGGDTLVSVAGESILSARGALLLGTLHPGAPVRLGVRRNGAQLDVVITPGARWREKSSRAKTEPSEIVAVRGEVVTPNQRAAR